MIVSYLNQCVWKAHLLQITLTDNVTTGFDSGFTPSLLRIIVAVKGPEGKENFVLNVCVALSGGAVVCGAGARGFQRCHR